MSSQCTQLSQHVLLLIQNLSSQSLKQMNVNIGSKCILFKPTSRFSEKSLAVEKINTSKWKKLLKMNMGISTRWCILMTVNSAFVHLEEKKELKKKFKRTRFASTIYSESMITLCRFKTSLILSSPRVLSMTIFSLFNFSTVLLWLTTTCFGTSRIKLWEGNHILS